MAVEGFKIYKTPEDTLRIWARQLNFMFNNLNSDNIMTTELTLGPNQVKASNIDFGVGANQVDASDIPANNPSSYFASGTVEGQLTQIASTLLNIPVSNVYFSTVDSVSDILVYSTDGLSIASEFACNGATPQPKYVVEPELSTILPGSTDLVTPLALSSDLNKTNSLLNQLRTALLNNGILST